MEKHLLLTVGEELSSLHAVRFVASFFKNKHEVRLTLFSVAPGTEAVDYGRVSPPKSPGMRGVPPHPKEHATLEASRKLLVDRGFPEDMITVKLAPKRIGTVKDIVYEGHREQYDAVILGRRGYAIFEQALATSVSRELLEYEIDFPLWICRRPEEGRRNVLLCVDGSEASSRITDHVGFMLQQEKDHSITVLHVDTGEVRDAQALLHDAKEILTRNGIEEERITLTLIKASKPAQPLLQEADRGAYAAVAVGRGKVQAKGIFKKWLVGSTSTKLLESLDKAALWVSK